MFAKGYDIIHFSCWKLCLCFVVNTANERTFLNPKTKQQQQQIKELSCRWIKNAIIKIKTITCIYANAISWN